MPSKGVPEHADVLWTFGPLRCFLFPGLGSHKYIVQVWMSNEPVCEERYVEEHEAMDAADRFREMFLKPIDR